MHLFYGPGQMTIATKLNLIEFMFLQLYIFPEFPPYFVVLTIKIYPVLRFVLQFSEFFIQGNRLRSLLAVTNGSVKIHISWLMHGCK
jgi:hypothetical protein